MGKQIRVKLYGAKCEKYKPFHKAVCQNIMLPNWVASKKLLLIDFMDEINSLTFHDINCSRKNIKTILSEYFTTIIFYNNE